jgi:type I restriction enzyme, S subunit
MKSEWRTGALGDLCEFQRGLTYAKTDEVESSANVVLRATNIDLASNQLDLSELRFIRNEFAVPDNKKVKKNSLIICTASGSKSHLGKVAYIDDDYGYAFGGFMGMLIPKPDIAPRYLFHLLTSRQYKDYIAALSDGANINNLKFDDLAAFSVPYPNASEQQRIVGILDEAFESIATARGNTERNLHRSNALFASELNAIFGRGNSWPTVSVAEVAEVFDGPHATPKTVDHGPVFLGISALEDGRVNLGETRHVTPADFDKWTRRVRPQAGDAVFSYETRLGQAALIPEGLECCLGRRMGLVRVDRKRVDPRFFVYQYISPPYREFLATKTVRGATVDRIPLKEFPSFPVALPTLQAQQRIADKLDLLGEETAGLILLYQRKLAALDELKQSLLHQAFSGAL